MRNIIALILIAATIALFMVPESAIGEYEGLLKIKHGLRDVSLRVKNIAAAFARTGEKPTEIEAIEEAARKKFDIQIDQLKAQLKEQAKDTLKEAATETIDSF